MDGLDALKISEEKKKYIVELLNPVLEEMVAECIHRMPSDPVPFMLDWLEQKKVSEEDKMLSPEEKERLMKENKELAQNVTKVKNQMQAAASIVFDTQEEQAKPEAEEEDEEDDEIDEPPPGFGQDQPVKARQSVSAEAYGEWNAKKAFVPQVIPKTDQQKDRLKAVLSKSLLFQAVDSTDLGIVIGAMKEVPVKAKERVIKQGENGDFLFVIESGLMECLVKGASGEEIVVKTCQTGDVFGELSLMYDAKRAASVEAKEDSVCWQLDRECFNHIVKEAAQKRRQRYDKFLSKVPLLSHMPAYERGQLADGIKSETYDGGQTIVSQGEVGHKFYIVEEGSLVATKGGEEVMTYAEGDYFGELALIRNQPRAATVTTKGPATLLTVDSKSFHRLLNVKQVFSDARQYTN